MTSRILILTALLMTTTTLSARAAEPAGQPATATKKVAAIVTVYHHNSHADVIVSRLMQTDTLDDQGRKYDLQLASLYIDQDHPRDIGKALAAKYGVPIYDTIEKALTLGKPGGELAVDGVFIIGEHGNYPKNPYGNTAYPKRRFFEETVKVFERSGRVVPVFNDKHIADNWEDMKWIYDTAQRLKVPLMAGSSLPVLWRRPEADVPRGAPVEQIVTMSYHTLDHYGFHGLELTQALVERRQGGETGIKAVQCLSKQQVWEAMNKPGGPDWDPELFEMARKVLPRDLTGGRPLQDAVPEPTLFILEYADGLKAYVFTLNGAVGEWSAAWKLKDGTRQATWFYTQEARPFMHFTHLTDGVEQMILTGKPTWPAERTLMTSGALDALLISLSEGGKRLETPQLMFGYQSAWDWQQPPPPPPDRPIMGQ